MNGVDMKTGKPLLENSLRRNVRHNGDQPFCHPVNYVATNSFFAFTCGSTAFSRGQKTALLQTTFAGATTTRSYGLFGATVTGTAPGTGGGDENVEPSAAPTDGDGDGNGGGDGGGDGGAGGSGDNQSSTPVGAIVGGVVGGIAAIAIAAGAGAFYYRRKKKRSQEVGSHDIGSQAAQPENPDIRSPKWPLLNSGQAAKIPEYPVEMDATAPVRQVHELGDTGHPTSPPAARQVHELG
ncbi:hypothetical protein MCOR25_007771 [Pyricularia grisea]|nr:hypothetical protein MCOR25_007771 [Pyricularia grisea]